MKVANLQRMGSFPAVATNRASRRDFAKQANMFNEIARRNAQRTEVAKGKEQLIFRMKASEIERKPKPVVVEMPKPSIYAPLRRAAVILLSIVGLAIAGETMGQFNYDPQKVLNPGYVRTVADKYFAIPENARINQKENDVQSDDHLTFNIVFLGAQEERETNPNLSLFNERMAERERVLTRVFTPQEDEHYHFGFTNVYIWFLENRTKLSPIELRSQLDQKIEQELGALFRKFEPPKKQEPLQPLTLGANQ